MKNFQYHNPTKIFFGRDSEKNVGAEIKQYSDRVLVLYGGGSVLRNGALNSVRESLESVDLEYFERGGILANPRVGFVREAIKLCQEKDIGFILAVGGGSVIDTAKGIAIGVQNQGDVWEEFYMQRGRYIPNALPLGAVVTIPAAGSETSDGSVLTNEESMLKRALNAPIVRAKFACINPIFHLTLPHYQTASGICDIFSHLMERYFTPVNHVDFTDKLIEGSMKSLILNAYKVLKEPNNYDYRAEIAWIASVAHNGLLDTGRGGEWSSYFMAQELSALYDIAHGASLAIIIPSWMRYVCHEQPDLFIQFAVRVMHVEDSFRNKEDIIHEGINRLEKFFRDLRMPVTFSDAKIPINNLVEMSKRSVFATGKIGTIKTLYAEDVLEIYKMAGEIK